MNITQYIWVQLHTTNSEQALWLFFRAIVKKSFSGSGFDAMDQLDLVLPTVPQHNLKCNHCLERGKEQEMDQNKFWLNSIVQALVSLSKKLYLFFFLKFKLMK